MMSWAPGWREGVQIIKSLQLNLVQHMTGDSENFFFIAVGLRATVVLTDVNYVLQRMQCCRLL